MIGEQGIFAYILPPALLRPLLHPRAPASAFLAPADPHATPLLRPLPSSVVAYAYIETA